MRSLLSTLESILSPFTRLQFILPCDFLERTSVLLTVRRCLTLYFLLHRCNQFRSRSSNIRRNASTFKQLLEKPACFACQVNHSLAVDWIAIAIQSLLDNLTTRHRIRAVMNWTEAAVVVESTPAVK